MQWSQDRMEWDLFGKLSFGVSASLWDRNVFQGNDVIHSRATFSLSGITNESPSWFSMEKKYNIPCIDTCLRVWMLQNCVFHRKDWDKVRQILYSFGTLPSLTNDFVNKCFLCLNSVCHSWASHTDYFLFMSPSIFICSYFKTQLNVPAPWQWNCLTLPGKMGFWLM